MRYYVILCLFVMFSTNSKGQTKRSFTVEPGQKVVEVIPSEVLYSFSQFTFGTVQLKDASEARVKLNYNSVFGEIQYIDPANGDTLSLADEKNIRFVAIERDTFYYDEGWLQLISSTPTLKLAKKRLLEMSNKEKLGPMDSPGFGAIETYNKYTGSQQMRNLVAKERITFTEHVTYFLGDRFNKFSRASKKGVLKAYAKNEKELGEWMDENDIDLTKGDDLQKLLAYLKSL